VGLLVAAMGLATATGVSSVAEAASPAGVGGLLVATPVDPACSVTSRV